MKTCATILSILFLLAPAALAQNPEPDTTDAWRYLPFHLGDVWEYERWEDRDCTPTWPPICHPESDGFLRREVVRDTLFGSEKAWIVRESWFNDGGLLYTEFDRIVRYDTTDARAYEYRLDGDFWGYWPDGLPCSLDMEFYGEWGNEDCDGYGAYAGSYPLEVFGMMMDAKTFVLVSASWSFVADIGLVSTSFGKWTMSGYDIVYARVDGVEYGTRFPVASEPAPEAASFGLAIHPNPLRGEGTLTLRLARPERVRVEVFDVLGRRVATVHDGALPPGEHALSFDASGLPPGLYLIRSASASASSTIRATVTR